ncbi:uncharacterized protein VTP21DRAFT_313 [Calcarisporiella thermophila]|uniref:uncharacterized protein n=1 Tax=Calcarisporiella thermophila TaxID=911321 RepID=UPI003743D409
MTSISNRYSDEDLMFAQNQQRENIDRIYRSRLFEPPYENNDTNEIHPADLMINRLATWRVLIERFIEHFNVQADAHEMTVQNLQLSIKQMTLTANMASNFIPQGGILELCTTLSQSLEDMSRHHTKILVSLKMCAEELTRLKLFVESKIVAIQRDTSISNNLITLRHQTYNRILHLTSSISQIGTLHEGKRDYQNDPCLINLDIKRKLQRLVDEESSTIESLLNWQHNLSEVDIHIYLRLFDIVQIWMTEFIPQISSVRTALSKKTATIVDLRSNAGEEWTTFAERNATNFLDPGIPLRTVDDFKYPYQNHFAVTPLYSGELEKKSMLKMKPRIGLLTPLGFFYEFKAPRFYTMQEPKHSLFIPNCKIDVLGGFSFVITEKLVNFLNTSKNHIFRTERREEAREWIYHLYSITNILPGCQVSLVSPVETPSIVESPSINTNDKKNASCMEEWVCDICFSSDGIPTISKCLHISCYDCFTAVVKTQGRCPFCRTSLNENDLDQLLP